MAWTVEQKQKVQANLDAKFQCSGCGTKGLYAVGTVYLPIGKPEDGAAPEMLVRAAVVCDDCGLTHLYPPDKIGLN